jgi:hypothetical protein
MSDIYKMQLHDTIELGNMHITKVPGGWIYRFYELEQTEGAQSGIYTENYRLAAVFVPLNQPLPEGGIG